MNLDVKNIQKELLKKEEELKHLTELKNAANTQVAVYKKVFDEAVKELVDEGFDPKNLAAEKAKLEDEIQATYAELEKLLPENIIDKYKDITVDDLMNKKVFDKIDLNQDF